MSRYISVDMPRLWFEPRELAQAGKLALALTESAGWRTSQTLEPPRREVRKEGRAPVQTACPYEGRQYFLEVLRVS